MKIRKAKIADIKQIHKLINEFAKKGKMVPRPVNELYENIRDFVLCGSKSDVTGVCAIHIMWEDLAEIRSLVVKPGLQGKGIGKRLVNACLKEAKGLGVKKVFALTYEADFFMKIGFKVVDKSKLPQKIWGDCLKCPKFPECDETAVIIEI